jgi:very-short-patch-repair endonuclease
VPSKYEQRLIIQIVETGLPRPERQARLIEGRRFSCDFTWRAARVVCEVEGGSFMAGRHTRGASFRQDCEKYNLLALAGWLVLRVTDEHIRTGDAIAWIAEALDARLGLGLRDEDERTRVEETAHEQGR